MKYLSVLAGLFLLTACSSQTYDTSYTKKTNQYVPIILSDENNNMAPVVNVCGQGAYTAYLNSVYPCGYAPIILP